MRKPRERRVLAGKRLTKDLLMAAQRAFRASGTPMLTVVQREALLETFGLVFEDVYALGLAAGQNLALEEAERHLEEFVRSVRTPESKRPPRLAGIVDGVRTVIGELRSARIQREADLGTSEYLLKFPMRRGGPGRK